MNGLQYALDLIDRTFGTTIKKSKQATKGLDNAVGKANDNISKIQVTGRKSFGGLERYAKRAAKVMVGLFAAGQVFAFGSEITTLTGKFEGFENAIRFASGSEGAQNIGFVNQKIKDLSLDMTSAFKGFQTLSGSLKGTKLEGQGVRDIFDAVSIASTSMNLSAEQSEGAFLALSQMASKGKVQAEELRGQLGERIPGALAIAARAMNMNQMQFNKMLDSGNVYAEDFLPKFAKELKATFEGGLPAAAKSMQASINKKNNAILSFKRATAGFFRALIVSSQNSLVKILQYVGNLLPKLEALKNPLMNLFAAFKPLINAVMGFGNVTGGVNGVISMLKSTLEFITPIVEIFATGIGVLLNFLQPLAPVITGIIALQWAWNVAMTANPIGLVIAAIVALVGIVSYAFNKVGWFRGGIMAAWETIKGFGMAIKTAVINRFKEMLKGITGVAKAIKLIFDGEWKKAFETGKKATANLLGLETAKGFIKDVKQVGKSAGKAYEQGVAEAALNSKKNKGSIIDQFIKKSTVASTSTGSTATGTVPGGGGTTGSTPSIVGGGGNKTNTLTIRSLVENLTVQVQKYDGNPQNIKREMENVFQEIAADLFLRLNEQ